MKHWFKRNQLYILLLVFAVAAGVGAYYYINHALENRVPPVGVNDKEEDELSDAVNSPSKNKEEQPSEVNSLRCPLDGEVVSSLPQDRPLAVMIGNSPVARPVYGVADADLVYEALVEGGITRLMAVYYHGQSARIGSIRSARPYFISLAQDTGAVYVHVGESPQAQTFFKKYGIDHLNEMPITRGFWRVNDRVPPHNLFSSTENLHQLAKDFNMDEEMEVGGFEFEKEIPAASEDFRKSEEIIIYYPEKYSQVKYAYQSDTDDYLRYMGGKAYIDGSKNSQLRAKNIIIQYVNTKVMDGEGRLAMDVMGEGKILVFKNGIAYEGKWSKSGLEEPTKYYDINGEEMKFSPGQIWIQIVPSDTRIDY